ncbi:MAG: cobalamin-dependent protein, partial [Magnetococcus sp. YQC-5]
MKPVTSTALKTEPDDVSAREAIAHKITTLLGSTCQRILLVQSLVLDETALDVGIAMSARYYACPPYGIGMLTTNLKKRGYTVQIEDLNYRVLAYINQKKDPNISPAEVTAFWQAELQKVMETFQPDLIGLSCMYAIGHGMTGRTADFVKSLQPNCPVFLGGVHATVSMEAVLQDFPSIDFVALFECDISFADLLDFSRGRCGMDRLSQVATRIDGVTVALPDRRTPMADDIQERPDYCDLPIGEYSKVGQIGLGSFWYGRNVRAGSMLSNRGCRAHCSFCSTRYFNGPGV